MWHLKQIQKCSIVMIIYLQGIICNVIISSAHINTANIFTACLWLKKQMAKASFL